MKKFKIAVLMGGESSEREVSLVSGKFVSDSIAKSFEVEQFRLDKNEIPQGISPNTHIVFPAMHGEYGEDGTLQRELEAAGFSYAGSDSAASGLCMNKPAAKAAMGAAEIKVAKELVFDAQKKPSAEAVIAAVGERAILKPADKGSSVGLKKVSSPDEIKSALDGISEGLWMFEALFEGREFSIGVIDGKAAGIVEIIPEGGLYDFKRKYTSGATRYDFPAKVSAAEEAMLKRAAEKAFAACKCRDFSRVDFLMNANGEYICLEINTLPGMTPTSLLPKSVSCIGMDFDALTSKMLEGAIKRFEK